MFRKKYLLLWDTFKAQARDLGNAKLDELNIERDMVPKTMTHFIAAFRFSLEWRNENEWKSCIQ